MARCRQITNHYLSQIYPGSLKRKCRHLTKFSSLAALEVVILTTSSTANDEHFIKMKTFPFQWSLSLYGVTRPQWVVLGYWRDCYFMATNMSNKHGRNSIHFRKNRRLIDDSSQKKQIQICVAQVQVQVQVQVVMTKSQFADYTRCVMNGAEGVRRDQCDEEWDMQYKNREVRDGEGRDKEGDKGTSPGEGC